MLTYDKTCEPCPSFVFLLLIRHLSSPWWHPSLTKNANKTCQDNVSWWRKYTFTCNISAIPNQNHEEHCHCRRDLQGSGSLQKYFSAFPPALSWKNVTNTMPTLKEEFNFLHRMFTVKKLHLPSLWRNISDLCVSNHFSAMFALGNHLLYLLERKANLSGNLKTSSACRGKKNP